MNTAGYWSSHWMPIGARSMRYLSQSDMVEVDTSLETAAMAIAVIRHTRERKIESRKKKKKHRVANTHRIARSVLIRCGMGAEPSIAQQSAIGFYFRKHCNQEEMDEILDVAFGPPISDEIGFSGSAQFSNMANRFIGKRRWRLYAVQDHVNHMVRDHGIAGYAHIREACKALDAEFGK